MNRNKLICGILCAATVLGGCGAQAGGEAAPVNLWPWILGLLGLAVLGLALMQTYCYIQYVRKARRRRRKNTHGVEPITVILYAAAAVLLLLALISGSFGGAQPDATGDPSESTGNETTGPVTGWVDDGEGRYYLNEDGTYATGWVDMDGLRYYFQDNGMTLSGWHEVEGILRYFRQDGSMARGEETIDGVKRFFTSTGAEVLLVNPWNPIPEDYVVEVRDLSVIYAVDDIQVDVRIYDALIEMMDACNKVAPRCCVTSAYRTAEDQESIYNNRVNRLVNQGYGLEEAREQAKTMASLPGYSEHQLGLAVDIIDTRSWSEEAEDGEIFPAQQWLMEHSWEYGFILRYPADKTEITGIMFEPWHFRYVGKELAKEIYESGLTLEEYIAALD